MASEETIAVVIQCLAEKAARDPGELTSELEAAGPEFPFDSIWLVSAGASAASRMGVSLVSPSKNAEAFKSVTALAGYLERCREPVHATR